MNSLFAEYNRYVQLISRKNMLDSRLSQLSGNSDNITEINEIASELGEISTEVSRYNTVLLEKVNQYFNANKEFNRICGELRTIEQLSKKSKGEKESVLSAENKKKEVDKELVDEYRKLVEEKKKYRMMQLRPYQELKEVTTLLSKTEPAIDRKNDENVNDYVLPDLPSYDKLSNIEKIKELEKYVQRIFDSALLPGQGKKVIVNYNGEKKTIPEKYKGRLNEALIQLSSLRKIDTKKDNEQVVSNSETEELNKKLDSVLDEINKDLYGIEIKPSKVPKGRFRINKSESHVTTKNKRVVKKISELLTKFNNIDKRLTLSVLRLEKKLLDKGITIKNKTINFKKGIKQKYTSSKCSVRKVTNVTKSKFKREILLAGNLVRKVHLSALKLERTLLDKGIIIKNNTIKFKEGVKQKYTSSKCFVENVTKSAKNRIASKYNQVKNFFHDKKIVLEKSKNVGLQKAMEEVYGESKGKHLDYRIVNKAVRFKNNMCYRVNERKSKICEISRQAIDKIKEPFDRLKYNMKADITREELEREIALIKIENAVKKQQLFKTKTKKMGGYVASGTLAVLLTIIIATIVFVLVGNIVNK